MDIFILPPDTDGSDTDVSHLYCQTNSADTQTHIKKHTSAGDRYRKTGTSEIREHSTLILIDLFGKDML